MKADIYGMILSWNGREDTLRCLESLRRIKAAVFQIVVVDNGSQDDTPSAVRDRFPEVELISTGRNLGYSEGNNFGLRLLLEREPEFICLFNNDTVVDPGFLAPLLACASTHPQVGIFGPRICFLARPDIIWSQGIRVSPTSGRIVSPDHGRRGDGELRPRTVDAVSGAAFLIRRRTLEEAGLLDERYAFYHEDVDLCLRARKAGWKTMVVPASRAWHSVGAAMKEAGGRNNIYYLVRNHLLVINRSFPRLLPFRVPRNLFIILYNLLFILFTTRRGDIQAIKACVDGVRDYLRGRWGMRGEGRDGKGRSGKPIIEEGRGGT